MCIRLPGKVNHSCSYCADLAYPPDFDILEIKLSIAPHIYLLPNEPPLNRATGKNIPIAISLAGMFKKDDLT